MKKGKLVLKEEQYGVVVDGKYCPFEYEEMVELLAAGRESTYGNESLQDMKDKVKKLSSFLLSTAY